MNNARLKKQLEVDELRSKRIYTDTVGKISGGIGRNLTDRGFSDDEIDLMYANDVRMAEADARALVANFDKLNDVRQEVLVNMSFNLGKSRLAGFKKFLAAVAIQDFSRAADEMKDSAWYGQVKDRGVRLVYAMRFGGFK
tara:strand:+ start:12115 stop:12534 length:420 start_codon:yes stop_codon:yes gene_type:complete